MAGYDVIAASVHVMTREAVNLGIVPLWEAKKAPMSTCSLKGRWME